MTGPGPSAPLEAILPEGVRVAAASGDAGSGPLLPPEPDAVRHATADRVAEYTTGRHLARRALAELGVAPVALPTAPTRAPVWPPGVVGSITHCAGYRAAAVARREHLAALGIDAEPDLPLPGDTLGVIASDAERAALAGLPPGPVWDRLLFSVKESLFKAWHPLMGFWLDFGDADVRLHPDGCARVRLAEPLVADGRTLGELTARWHATGGLLATAVAVGAAQRGHAACVSDSRTCLRSTLPSSDLGSSSTATKLRGTL